MTMMTILVLGATRGCKGAIRIEMELHLAEAALEVRSVIVRASGHPNLPERRFPWGMMRAFAVFGGFPHEVMEVRPFWKRPTRLDGRRLSELLGDAPCTLLNAAVIKALTS